MKNIKKFFALLLTCAVIFSALSGAIVTRTLAAAPAVDGSKFIRVEAEPGDPAAGGYDPNNYATLVSYHFTQPNQTSAQASAGKWAGTISCDHNKMQDFVSLSEYFDAANTPAVTYTVNAPEAGEYEILPGYMVNNASKWDGIYFMAILVNDHDAYKCAFSKDASTNFNTNSIKVNLNQNSNIIRLIPFVADTKDVRTSDYINVDYLDIDKTLTPVYNQAKLELEVEKSEYNAGFSNTKDNLSGDKSADAKAAGITASSFTKDDLEKLSYFSYTVEVDKTGYYNMNLSFLPNLSWRTDPFYYGVLINGVPYSVGAARATNNASNYDQNVINICARLKAGVNVITVTNALALENAKTESVPTTTFETLTIYGDGVKLADEQIDPLTYGPIIDYDELSFAEYATSRGYNTSGQLINGDFNLTSTDYAQTYAEMSADGAFLNKCGLPYAAYHVSAPKAGTYSIKPNITVNSTADNGKLASYFFIVSVNDKRYYKIENITKGSFNAYPLDVELDKGVNVIRCIPFCKDTYDNIGDIGSAQLSLYVQSVLRGVKGGKKLVKGNETAFNKNGVVTASTITALNVRDVGVSKNLTNVINGGIKFDTFKQDTIEKTAYIAHTFNVPADGYYDMSLIYNAVIPADHQGNGLTGYFIVRVDGTKYKVNFCESTSKSQTADDSVNNAANISLYMTKGDHTILVSSIMDWACPGYGSGDYHSTFLQGIEVGGGMTVAADQVDPIDIPDEVTPDTITSHLEAEIFAESYGFSKPKAKGIADCKARGAVSGLNFDFGKAQSYATLTDNLDKKNNAYVTFTVNAKNEGDYNIYPIYRLKGIATGGYKMTILVNDATAYQSAFTQDADKAAGWNKSTVSVHLKKGINVIRLIPFTSDNKSSYAADCIDIDYLGTGKDVYDDATEPVIGVLPQTVTLNSGESTYRNGFATVTTGLGGQSASMKDNKITVANINKRNVADASYFSYTVTADYDGYYDISLPYTIGQPNNGPLSADEYNLAFYMDGAAKPIKLFVFDKSANSSSGIANASTYLTAGDHALVFIAQLPKDGSDTALYGWTDFSTVSFSSGLKVAEKQINPIQLNRLEAEVYGETSTYDAKEKGGYSGGYSLANGTYADYKGIRAAAQMETGNFNTSYPNAVFTVDVPSECDAEFRVGYSLGGSNSNAMSQLDAQYKFIYVYIKDAAGNTRVYHAKNGEWINAHWGTGINTITTTILDLESFEAYKAIAGDSAKFWVNLDYVDIDDTFKGKLPRSAVSTRIEAEEYAERFNYSGTEEGNYSGGAACSQANYAYGSIYTEAEYMSCKYEDQPHLIYTIRAEKSGYYSMTSGYRSGTSGDYPSIFNTYFIVTNLTSKTKTAYKQEGSQKWVNNIYLEEGLNEVVATIFDKETYDACGAKGVGHTWMNIDFLDLYSEAFEDLEGSGLQYSIKGEFPESAAVPDPHYTRFEAETQSFPNAYSPLYKAGVFSGGNGHSTQSMETAQSLADIQTNGLVEYQTPNVVYAVNVPAEGDYDIRVGMAYKVQGNIIPDDYTGHVAIFINDDSKAYKIESFPILNNRLHMLTFAYNNVHLNAGLNLIKATSATNDTLYEKQTESGYKIASLFVYQDYLDVSGEGVSVIAPENSMEAETSSLRGYASADRGSASGGAMACNENFSKIIATQLTLDKLNSNPEYLVFCSYVEYEITADATGRYPITFVGASGKSGSPLTDDVFFGLSVNSEKFDRVDYRVYNKSSGFSRTVWVDLNEGKNIIRTTCILKDIIKASGNLYYIDHDCVLLPKELHGVVAEIIPPGAGDEDMEVAGHLVMSGDAAKVKQAVERYIDEEGNEIEVTDFRVRCESFFDRDDAVELVEQLTAAGYQANILTNNDEPVVYVGVYNNIDAAETMAKTLVNAGYEDAYAVALNISSVPDTVETVTSTEYVSVNGEYGADGESPITGEKLMLVLPMILALAAISGMYAFFKRKKNITAE